MRRLAPALALLLLPACANVGQGLSVAQRGLAVVDVGVDQFLELYVEAVNQLRAYCDTQPDRLTCQTSYGVTDEDITAVEIAVALMSEGYDDTAEGLAKMKRAWELLAPRLQKTIDAAENLTRS